TLLYGSKRVTFTVNHAIAPPPNDVRTACQHRYSYRRDSMMVRRSQPHTNHRVASRPNAAAARPHHQLVARILPRRLVPVRTLRVRTSRGVPAALVCATEVSGHLVGSPAFKTETGVFHSQAKSAKPHVRTPVSCDPPRYPL